MATSAATNNNDVIVGFSRTLLKQQGVDPNAGFTKRGNLEDSTESAHLISFEVMDSVLTKTGVTLTRTEANDLVRYMNHDSNVRIKTRDGNRSGTDGHLGDSAIDQRFISLLDKLSKMTKTDAPLTVTKAEGKRLERMANCLFEGDIPERIKEVFRRLLNKVNYRHDDGITRVIARSNKSFKVNEASAANQALAKARAKPPVVKKETKPVPTKAPSSSQSAPPKEADPSSGKVEPRTPDQCNHSTTSKSPSSHSPPTNATTPRTPDQHRLPPLDSRPSSSPQPRSNSYNPGPMYSPPPRSPPSYYYSPPSYNSPSYSHSSYEVDSLMMDLIATAIMVHTAPSSTYTSTYTPSYDYGFSSGFTGSPKYFVSSNPTGPLTIHGLPDMRYSSNRGGRR